MTTLAIIPADAIVVNESEILTSSLKVAEAFNKLHKNVIQKIESLECSSEFNRLNFKPVEYRDAKGEKRPCWEMTKDGFMFLVMGFTGKLAAQIKEAYINAFNKMAEKLKTQYKARTNTDERTGLRNAVNLLVSKKGLMYPDAYSLVHQRFNIEHLDELTKDQLPQAVEYIHKLALEGEYLPAAQPPALTVKPQFTDEELNHLAWLWRVSDIMLTGIKEIYPLLAVAEHKLAPVFLTWKREYPYTLKRAQRHLIRESLHIPVIKGGDPVLLHLREFRETN
ncbi:Rha family transcriptional regulator [Alishewanella sp. 16-MA]|uniref:Rha family transcriptional regulator n=1 Tax=Alishewanella maricola TaxID=2795740 RepID=A0ABS8C1J0_9ALTE|nr:Rha family transcriptional regulator [Alishewanella maricola]MCB5226197.1 Rha family transcriptional regulator [Alishewanella maricola]